MPYKHIIDSLQILAVCFKEVRDREIIPVEQRFLKIGILWKQLALDRVLPPPILYFFFLFPCRGHPIKAENFEGFKEDTETMKRFPLRAWTDSAYHETQYVHLEIPKLGLHPVAIVTLKDENVLNLRFPVLSSDRNSK